MFVCIGMAWRVVEIDQWAPTVRIFREFSTSLLEPECLDFEQVPKWDNGMMVFNQQLILSPSRHLGMSGDTFSPSCIEMQLMYNTVEVSGVQCYD